MIIELRTYTFKPGLLPAFMALYEAEGVEVQKRVLGNMLGYYTTEIGMLNQVVHLWGYDSFEDRARRRAELSADAGWQGYLAKAMPMMETQESKLLLPTKFSPVA